MSAARHTFHNFLTIACNAVTGLVLTALIARWLSPSGMGTYALVTWWLTMAGLAVNMGWLTTTMKHLAESRGRGDEAEAAGVLSHGLGRILRNGVVVSIVWLALSPLIASAYPQHALAGPLAAGAAAILPVGAMALLAAAAQGRQAYGHVAAVTAVYTVLMISLTLGALLAGWGVTGVIGAMAVAGTVATGLYWRGVGRWQRGWRSEQLPPERKKALAAYGAPLVALIALDAIVWQRSGVFFLGLWSEAQEVAFYALAFSLAMLAMRLVPGTLVGLLIPSMSKAFGSGDLAQVASTYRTANRWMAMLALPVAIGGAALSGPLVALLYGQGYEPVALPLTVLLVSGAFAMIFGFPASSVLYAVEGQRELLKVGAGVAALYLALACVLVPALGAIGAALATAIAQVASLAPGAYFVSRRLGGVTPDASRLPATMAAALGMGVPVWALAAALPPVWALALAVPVGALVYGALLWLLGALAPEDRQRLAAVAARLPGLKRILPAGA